MQKKNTYDINHEPKNHLIRPQNNINISCYNLNLEDSNMTFFVSLKP